jgi:ketosteroid isomerase-like protein
VTVELRWCIDIESRSRAAGVTIAHGEVAMAPDVDVVRRLYAAVAAGDIDGAAACFAADALWHLPGTAPISGDHRGWAAIRKVIASSLRLSGGTFRAELVGNMRPQHMHATGRHRPVRGPTDA